MPFTLKKSDTTELGPVMRPQTTRASRRLHVLKAVSDSVCLSSLGVAGWVAAPLFPELGSALPVAGAALAGTGIAAAVTGAQRAGRQELITKIAEGLAPKIGGVDAAKIRASRWTGGWIGVPGRLQLTYSGSLDGLDPLFVPVVLRTIATRVQREYEVVGHDPTRCRLVLKLLPTLGEREPVPALATRGKKIVDQLFGESAAVDLDWSETELNAINVRYETSVRYTSLARRLAIQKSINDMLPGRWSAHWDLEADLVKFGLRPTLPTMVPHPVMPVEGSEAERIPIGVDENGASIYWSLAKASGTPHFLCNGATGTGKTVIIRGAVMEAARRSWRVWVCDPKRIEFVGMRDWPNVEVVATAVEDIVAVIGTAVREMERRYRLMEAGYAAKDFERILLVIDEVRYFYLIANAWWQTVRGKKSPSKIPLLDDLLKLLILSRACGINVLMGTQRPDAEWLGGEARDQLAARCSLGRLSPQGAGMMWGAQHIGVSVPRGVAGRGTGVNADGEPVEFQGFWTPDPLDDLSEEDAAMLEALRPATTRYPRRCVIRPEPLVDADGQPMGEEGRYEEYLSAPLELLSDHPELAGRPDLVVLDREHLPDPDQFLADLPAWQRENVPAFEEYETQDLYGEADEIHASAVEPGDLVCLDESTNLWVVVETAEPDMVDEGSVAICYRLDDEDGDPGVTSIDASDVLQVRRAIADVEPGLED